MALTTVLSLANGGVITIELAAPSTTSVPIFTPKSYSSKRYSSGATSVSRSSTFDVNQHQATATDKFTSDDVSIVSPTPVTTTNSAGQTIVYPLLPSTYTSQEGVYTTLVLGNNPYTASVSAGESNGSSTVGSGILPTSTIIAIVVAFVVGIAGIITTSFCVIRTRRRRRRREETARRVAAQVKKEYDEKLPRLAGTGSQVTFTQSPLDFSTSGNPSPISPFGDEQRVRYDTAVEVMNDSADAASINMVNGRAMSMGRQQRSSHQGTSGGRIPSRARTLEARSRNRNGSVIVRELDSDRASARGQTIRTLPIREGDITPYTLPPMPAPTMRSVLPTLSLRIPPEAARIDNRNLHRPVPPVIEWRRPSDDDTVHTLGTDDDDAFAEDGSSLARTLTTESGDSGTFPATHGMFRSQHGHEADDRSASPVAWGPGGPFDDEYQAQGLTSLARLAQQGDFDDASTIGETDGIAPSLPTLSVNTGGLRGLSQTPTLTSGQTISSSSSRAPPLTYLSPVVVGTVDPFADPTTTTHQLPRRRPAAPQSDAGQSEVSMGAVTEASYVPGDDARSDVLNLGSRWRNGNSRTMMATTTTMGTPSTTIRNGVAVTYREDLDSEDDQTTPSDTSRHQRLVAPPTSRTTPAVVSGAPAVAGDTASAFDDDEYIRTLEGAISCGRRTEDGREVLQLPPSYNEVFGDF
ncbi:hypothetical protein QFC19_006456 [Naganishia cerealis]|uniref:Uncharacterized protein n=1 Tax=Naganishia cerealis TaxID=610337 RepID=A0ACC2VGB6_9TREE|nr:hypothetical protein QFC19_006456 [Naganishia cerealis]